ncbi:MAG: hypothetical protein OEN22_05765 [Gammaproteobacteria bacterium]|nr:hypothetical protein [Gammaproteobacteria bacterium]
MKKLLLAIILAVPMVSTSYAQQEMSASGEVVSVRMMTRTMTVRDASSNEVIRYNVPMGTTVTLAGQPGRLGYLRSGDTVNVNYVNTDEGRETVRIRVPQPTSAMDLRITEGPMSTITGRVESINYGNRTITVLGDQSGQRFTYAIPEETRVTVGGENARIGHIQRGDNVTLRFKEEAGQRQAARVRVPQPVTPLAARRVQAAPAAVAQTAPRTQLPRTASSLPLFGLLGVLSLFAAGSLRLTRRVRRERS